MEFRIFDTFTDSLAKLTGQEQKVVKTTAFDLQLNPANPGMQFHKLNKSKDPDFWSVRASDDLRLIVHKTASSLLLCYVDHHDAAYAWAECRKIQRHPKTGAAQGARYRCCEARWIYCEIKGLQPIMSRIKFSGPNLIRTS
jgi:mRNA-degrading endonuclease RelE of RelBE toxin-antitoxin system